MPYTRNLMIDTSIRAYITKEEEKNEVLETSTIILPKKARKQSNFIYKNQPTFDPTYLENLVNEEKKEANSATGLATWCIDTIVQQQDLNEARILIKKKMGK